MTYIMTSKNIDLSSWDTLYIVSLYLYIVVYWRYLMHYTNLLIHNGLVSVKKK